MSNILRYTLAIGLMLLFYSEVFAENENLMNLFNAQKGIEKIKTGLLICDLLENPAEKLKFSKELLEKSRQIEIDQLLTAKILKKICDAYFYSDSIEKSIEIGEKALSLALTNATFDTAFVAELYNDVGLNYTEIENNTQATEYLNKAIVLYGSVNLLKEVADAKSNLANVFFLKGKFEDAIKLFSDVYQIDLKTGNVKSQASSLNSLGRMYVEWGKFETGIEYYKKSLQLTDTISDRGLAAIRYNNIGVACQLMGKHREAIFWISKALKIEVEENNILKIGIRQFNLGNSYLALRDFENASQNLLKAETHFKNSKMPSRLSKVYASLGQLNSETGNREKAETYLVEAQRMAELSGALPEMENVYFKLYQFYKKKGDLANTLKYFELRTNTKDSVFSLNVSKQVEELEEQYQTEKKEAEIVKLEAENQLRQKELKFRKRERNLAIAGLLLFAGLLAGLFKLFSTVKKQKVSLTIKNEQLDRLNHAQNRLFGIISHDMRNVAAAYQASSKVIQYHLGKGQPEKLIPIADEIGKNSRNLSTMLENLLQWAIIQLKGIEPAKQIIRVKEEFELLSKLFMEDAAKKNNRIEMKSDAETIWCDPESLRLILRNLMANALKFTDGGTITLKASSANSHTTITVGDTGCGMPKEIVVNLFQIGKEKVRFGTAGERGTGLGMLMVAEHVEKNNGLIEVNSVENKGTSFTVILPSGKS